MAYGVQKLLGAVGKFPDDVSGGCYLCHRADGLSGVKRHGRDGA